MNFLLLQKIHKYIRYICYLIIFLLIIFINFLICFLFFKTTYSEEKKFNYEEHKEKLIEKKLLLNSFKKCEEYINETSVELFLNCSDKNEKKK